VRVRWWERTIADSSWERSPGIGLSDVTLSGSSEQRWQVPLPRIAIVGDRNSGKTTFLGLLYTTQVKSGSDKADDFRFHAAFESLDEISGVFQRLMSGSFPDSATKEGIREITFRLGYRRPGRGIFSRQRSQAWASDSSVAFQLIVLKTFEDDMARQRNGGSIADATLRDAIGSDAMVIMVDSGKLVVVDDDSETASAFAALLQQAPT